MMILERPKMITNLHVKNQNIVERPLRMGLTRLFVTYFGLYRTLQNFLYSQFFTLVRWNVIYCFHVNVCCTIPVGKFRTRQLLHSCQVVFVSTANDWKVPTGLRVISYQLTEFDSANYLICFKSWSPKFPPKSSNQTILLSGGNLGISILNNLYFQYVDLTLCLSKPVTFGGFLHTSTINHRYCWYNWYVTTII